MIKEHKHEPQDLNMEYFMVIVPEKDNPDADVVEVFMCSKCHLLYWEWSEVKKDGGQQTEGS